MAENPFQSILNPNASRAGMWDMRMMASANRMEAPFEHMKGSYSGRSRSGGNLLSGMSGIANEPDYSQFTYDPVMRQQAITAGVQPLEASQVRSNAILPNTGFFGNHPRLSAALEGGIFGLANAHGGNTVGESIQGAMEGVIGGQRERQGILREQFARPFEASNMLEGLRDKQQRRELQAADIEHLRAVNEHYKNGDDARAAALENTQRHQEAMEAIGAARVGDEAPRNLGGGLYGYYNPGGTGPAQRGDWSIQENPEAKTGRTAAGAGPWYSFKDNKGATRYGRVHEGAQVPEGAKLVQGDYQQKTANKADTHRQTWIQNQLGKPGPVWMSAGVSPGDKQAAQKLGQFYDENIAPGMSQQAPSGGIPTYDPETGTIK